MATNNVSTVLRNTLADAAADSVDGGSGAGKMKIFTAAFALLLATLTFSDPAYGNASGGVAQENPISDDPSAAASGTAAVLRIETSAATQLWDGTVATSGADLNFNSVAFIVGDVISVSDFPINYPAA